MRRRNLFPICLGLLLIVAGCSKRDGIPASTLAPSPEGPSGAPRITSVKLVKATAQEVQLPASGSAKATVRITIQSGYHINANPPTYSYLKATELWVQTGNGVSVGFISYPTPITRKFSFAQEPLAVYEGETSLKVLLKADSSTAKGSRSLPAKLYVQACDYQVCYPPGTLDLSLPVTVK